MYKLLIVDDEKLICRMLEKILDWASLDIQLVGVAHNGQEAYEAYLTHQPDLVLTDVKMPICDGITFVKQVREVDDQVEFIIMSAYADFEYAQSAIKLNCAEYILKPIDEDELENSIKKIIARLKDTKEREQLVQDTLTQQNKWDMYHYMKNGHGNEPLGSWVDSMSIQWNQYVLLSIQLLSENINQYDYLSGLEKEQVHEMEDIIGSLAQGYGDHYMFNDEEGSWFLILSQGNKKQIVEYAHKLLDQFMTTYGLYANICFSEINSSIGQLPVAYTKVMILRTYNFYTDTQNILGYGYNCKGDEFDKLSLIDRQKDIIRHIKSGNKQKAVIALKDILQTSAHISPLHLEEFYEICYEIIILLKQCAMEEDVEKEHLLAITNISFLSLKTYNNITTLTRFMIDLISEFSVQYEDKPQVGHKAIERCIHYLNEHYREKLSLNDISDYMAMSKNYFCYMFKKETGKNLWTYLTEIRMEKAKEMLDHTNKKTYEIAYELGYENSNYFSKIFKKTYNMTPSDYKRGL